MAEWLFDGSGQALIIVDNDAFVDKTGGTIGWIHGINVSTLYGQHVGWYEGGVLYDSRNQAVAFAQSRTGYLPSMPGIGGAPGMPGFSGRPARPGLAGAPGRPGHGGWSNLAPAGRFQ